MESKSKRWVPDREKPVPGVGPTRAPHLSALAEKDIVHYVTPKKGGRELDRAVAYYETADEQAPKEVELERN